MSVYIPSFVPSPPSSPYTTRYDKDNIADSVITKIEHYIVMPEFTPKEVEKASKACTAICMWVRAMHKYHHVARAVEPKKKMLAEAQIALDETLAKLADAQSRLKVRIHSDRVHVMDRRVCVLG